MVNQPKANSSQPPNLARSEMEPLINATVMIANIIWKASTTYVGMPVEPHSSFTKFLVPRYWVKLPMMLLTPLLELVPKARGNPYASHSTEISPMHEKLIIIMLRTLLDRLSPP